MWKRWWVFYHNLSRFDFFAFSNGFPPYGYQEENINKAFPRADCGAGEDRGAPIHLHVMTCGTMRECLERCCSSLPPVRHIAPFRLLLFIIDRCCPSRMQWNMGPMDFSAALLGQCSFLDIFQSQAKYPTPLPPLPSALSSMTQADKLLAASTPLTMICGNQKHIFRTTTTLPYTIDLDTADVIFTGAAQSVYM